jgi:hypothetical protein
MAVAVKAKAKQEDVPVQEVPAEPVDWKIPIGVREILERLSRELNKQNREVLWLEFAGRPYEPPRIEAFEIVLQDGAPVKRIKIVERAIELGVIDLARESPQMGETI